MATRSTYMLYVVALFYIVFNSMYGGVATHTRYQWHNSSTTDYTYDPDPSNPRGVYNWGRAFPSECGGRSQSPINIITDHVEYNAKGCACPVIMYRSPIISGQFTNNGHSPVFMPDPHSKVFLSGIPHHDDTYTLHDFHFHYGGVTGRSFAPQGMRRRGSSSMSAGSEHTIDGLRFEGEMHFVFYNTRNASLEDAEELPEGVTVVVLLIEHIPVGRKVRPDTLRFSRFLSEHIPKVHNIEQGTRASVDMRTFFNRDCEYYTYHGSTTTPLCHQSVRWIIFREPLAVTERAWLTLTGLHSIGDFNARYGNYRVEQPLSGRMVEANFMRPEKQPIRPSPDGQILQTIGQLPIMPRAPGMQSMPRVLGPPRGMSQISRVISGMPMVKERILGVGRIGQMKLMPQVSYRYIYPMVVRYRMPYQMNTLSFKKKRSIHKPLKIKAFVPKPRLSKKIM